jgi:uncharacterized protein with NRDE domain
VTFRIAPNEDLSLVLVGNRDELHNRPTEPLHWWPEPEILAGRDLEAGGTWLAVSRSGRFGVLTNLRGYGAANPTRSRGHLIPEFLDGDRSPVEFMRDLHPSASRYAGFNVLLGDTTGAWLYSNGTPDTVHHLAPGYHGLSNGLYLDPWPKVSRANQALRRQLEGPRPTDGLADILLDRTVSPDAELPQTGLSMELERRLSAAFICHPHYGTRSTTVCILRRDGTNSMQETGFDPEGRKTRQIDVTF